MENFVTLRDRRAIDRFYSSAQLRPYPTRVANPSRISGRALESMPDPTPAVTSSSTTQPLGLLAGEGDFPVLIARAASSHRVPVIAFGINNLTKPELSQFALRVHWVELGQFRRVVDLCRQEGIRKVTLAGRIKHSSIFQIFNFDAWSLRLLRGLKDRKADTILQMVSDELAKEGIEVIDSTLFLKGLMPRKGLVTPGLAPGKEVTQDIEFGMRLARELARLDIGQTVVIKGKAVIAVEGMEGTDECIRRAGILAGPGIVVCKSSKPRQDFRFDVPIVGLKTLQTLSDAKGAALAFSAGETLLFNQDEVLILAKSARISIVAY